jgi:phosphate transport system substrate-binding protein
MEKGGAAPQNNQALQSPLTYEGASTIGTKIMPDAAKAFTAKTGVPFGTISDKGAGAGFKAVTEGKVSLGGLASTMSDKEKVAVAAWQIIGYDTMGVYVHPGNKVKTLSMAQLKGIFSGKIVNWKDLSGADQPIVVYSEKLSGGRATVRAFKDMVLGTDEYGPVRELDDAVDCIRDIEKDPAGITASSISFATPKVAAAAVDGYLPERAHVQSGKYPLKRPLSLITMMPSGNVQKFFEFMLSPEGQTIVAKHYVPVK